MEIKNIEKLEGKMLGWMEDFLKDRAMRTVIRGKESSWKRVLSGVPLRYSTSSDYVCSTHKYDRRSG